MTSRRRGAWVAGAVLLAFTGLCLGASLVAPFPPDAVDLTQLRVAPNRAHWLGTDDLGRDVLSRLLYGGRISILIGLTAAIVGTSLGAAVGATAGYLGGAIDNILMRATDVAFAVPTLPLAIVLGSYAGDKLFSTVLIIGALSWMTTARVIRSEVLTIREAAFVDAARGLGQRGPAMLARHVIPNVAGSLIVSATLGVGNAILVESALSFLGLGVQPPVPTWGNMLTDAQGTMATKPWLTLFPGMAILLVILCVNVCGDALRPSKRAA